MATQFDQRRVWLDELLALRHLWPHQVAQAQALAEELGVELVIVDKPLSWNGGEWKARGE